MRSRCGRTASVARPADGEVENLGDVMFGRREDGAAIHGALHLVHPDQRIAGMHAELFSQRFSHYGRTAFRCLPISGQLKIPESLIDAVDIDIVRTLARALVNHNALAVNDWTSL